MCSSQVAFHWMFVYWLISCLRISWIIFSTISYAVETRMVS